MYAGIDYTYINIKEEDINTRINVFTLDSPKQQ